MAWSWPWARPSEQLVTPEERARSIEALEIAHRVRKDAHAASMELVELTSPNHLGEKFHRALRGR